MLRKEKAMERRHEERVGKMEKGRDPGVERWVSRQVAAESYWFHKIRLFDDLVTPGWSDPEKEKLPYFGMPKKLSGLRVLDIGCAEGYFSFLAEKRGALEVVAIDSFPDSIRRFNICRAALDSKATAYLSSVYDLSPRTFGTFDLVLFYGVLYHLRNPLLALERILDVCTGTLLLQTAVYEVPGFSEQPLAKFYPGGMQSGPVSEKGEHECFDPTVFWMPNRTCVKSMVHSVGFRKIELVSDDPKVSIVLRAKGRSTERGKAPDQSKAPWS